MNRRSPVSPETADCTQPPSASELPAQPADTRRRRFLFGLGAGAASAAAAAVTAAPAPATSQGEPAGASKSRGYHETDHVRRFYQTARF